MKKLINDSIEVGSIVEVKKEYLPETYNWMGELFLRFKKTYKVKEMSECKRFVRKLDNTEVCLCIERFNKIK